MGGTELTDLAFGHLGWILSHSDRTNEEHRPIPSHMFGTLALSPESSIPFILFVGRTDETALAEESGMNLRMY